MVFRGSMFGHESKPRTGISQKRHMIIMFCCLFYIPNGPILQHCVLNTLQHHSEANKFPSCAPVLSLATCNSMDQNVESTTTFFGTFRIMSSTFWLIWDDISPTPQLQPRIFPHNRLQCGTFCIVANVRVAEQFFVRAIDDTWVVAIVLSSGIICLLKRRDSEENNNRNVMFTCPNPLASTSIKIGWETISHKVFHM